MSAPGLPPRWHKLLSARFWFALIAAGTFSFLACTSRLEAKDSMSVIMVVAAFYFGKGRG